MDKFNTLHRVVALLDCFTQDHPELGVREAARMVGLSSSTSGRLMAAMKDIGLLNQNPVTRAYSLGGKLLSWAGVYTSNLDVRKQALPLMEQLHVETLETISLYVLEGSERVCVERLESPHIVRIDARIGRRLPLYAGSAGKVFLAFVSKAHRNALLDSMKLEPLTSNTIADRQDLEVELDKVAEQGYAVSYGEWILEASGVAAPIYDQNGDISAALTISGPTQRFTEESTEKYSRMVTEVAYEISREMGYRGAPNPYRRPVPQQAM